LPVHYIKPFIEIKVGFVICLNFRRSLNGLATDFLALYSHYNVNKELILKKLQKNIAAASRPKI